MPNMTEKLIAYFEANPDSRVTLAELQQMFGGTPNSLRECLHIARRDYGVGVRCEHTYCLRTRAPRGQHDAN